MPDLDGAYCHFCGNQYHGQAMRLYNVRDSHGTRGTVVACVLCIGQRAIDAGRRCDACGGSLVQSDTTPHVVTRVCGTCNSVLCCTDCDLLHYDIEHGEGHVDPDINF